MEVVNKGAKANQNAIIVKFKNTEVELTRNDLYDLTHAYAISIHKSQGSEFKVVVMPIDSGSDHMLTKKLIYTAITRAKDKLIIIGDMNYFYKGIEQADIPRHTYLQKLLTSGTETPKQEKKLEQFSQEENAEISPFDFL